MSDISINMPHLSLEFSTERINGLLSKLIPIRDKTSALLLSFNFLTRDSSSSSVQNYQKEMSAIVEWQKLLQHYDPQISCAVKTLQGFKILLKNELETREAEIRTDSKLVNQLSGPQLTQVVRNKTTELRTKMAVLTNHLTMWETILDNYQKKARNLQTQYNNINNMLKVMERTGELDADPYDIVHDCAENLSENIKNLEEKCLPGISDIDLVPDDIEGDSSAPLENQTSESDTLEDLFNNLES